MLEGYCGKCKDKKSIADAFEVVMKNGRMAVKGRCPTCGGGVFKILGGKSPDSPAPEASRSPRFPASIALVQPAASSEASQSTNLPV